VDRAFAAIHSLDFGTGTPTQPEPAPVTSPFSEREKIYFQPAVVGVNQNGQPVLRPSVRVANQPSAADALRVVPASESEVLPPVSPPLETVPIPNEWSAPIVENPYEQYGQPCTTCAPRLGPCQELLCRIRCCLNGPRSPEPGIGTERVMHAISFLDTTQPQNNFRLRFDAAYDYQSPDRAEYFWAKIGGRGPGGLGGERTVDYQDIRAFMEMGDKKFSLATDLPIRIIDPSVYANSSGLGDINITTKTVFIDGPQWQIANLLRTYIPSGDTSAGLGTGHASIEPGFAFRYKWSDVTYLHGDLKYWIPLGADQLHGGEVLSYGAGMSHVWRDSDTYAVMPTLELQAFSFLDGQVTPPGLAATPIEVDGQTILNVHPGIRWVWDNGGDCGVREVGLFGGFSMTSNSLYEEMLRLEFRWTW
jgi:hypothetical protein